VNDSFQDRCGDPRVNVAGVMSGNIRDGIDVGLVRVLGHAASICA